MTICYSFDLATSWASSNWRRRSLYSRHLVAIMRGNSGSNSRNRPCVRTVTRMDTVVLPPLLDTA